MKNNINKKNKNATKNVASIIMHKVSTNYNYHNKIKYIKFNKKNKGSNRAEPNQLSINYDNHNKPKYLNLFNIYKINKKKKEGMIPQRSERVFQVNKYNIGNYINLSVLHSLGAESALVAQRSEHLSEKQGLPRHLGSSPSQGGSASFFSKKSIINSNGGNINNVQKQSNKQQQI